MINRVFLHGIIAEKPMVQKAANGKDFIMMIIINKEEQRKIGKDNKPVRLRPDNVIPVITFNPSYIKWLSQWRGVGDVLEIEGILKSPKRKLFVLATRIKLLESANFKAEKRQIIQEYEKRRHLNESSNN